MGLESKRGKQAMYSIYSFENVTKIAGQDISDFTSDGFAIKEMDDDLLEQKKVQLSESFFLHFYLKAFDKPYTRKMLLNEFILVDLSDKFSTMKKQCIDGIEFRGKRYVYFATSPNWLKHESGQSKGKALFIESSAIKNKNLFYSLISLGKITEYQDDKKISKELARIALGFSGAYKTNIVPKMIILPECTYNIISDVEAVKLKQAEVDDDFKVSYIQKENEVQVLRNHEVNVTQFDGCGCMTKELAQLIQQEMNLEHEVTWCGFRFYGLAVKGLVCSIDYKEYFHQNYTQDTDYIKKEDGKIYIKDYTDEWQCVDDSDMLLNESQVKWAGNFKNYEEFESQYAKLNKYKDLFTLYINKTNKANDEIKMNTTNYQLIGNLALTPKELKELQSTTENTYRKIISRDMDATSIFLNTFVTDSDEEITEDELSVSTKIGELLLLSPEFVDAEYVQNQIKKMLKKKMKHLMGGKFYIKNSYYQTAIQDPISYLDWIIGRTDKNSFIDSANGLKAHQFYNTYINDGEVRTVSRNPLNSYSEIQNLSFTQNEYINEWLGHLTKDMIVYNCYDLTKVVMSGMDFDMDSVFVVDNQIIRDAVIPALPFINIADINKVEKKMKWDMDNIVYAVHHSAGNFIGKLSNKGSAVSNRSSAYLQEYKTKTKFGTKAGFYNSVFKDKYPKSDETLVDGKSKVKKVNGKSGDIKIGSFSHFQVWWYRGLELGKVSAIVRPEEEIKNEIIDNFKKNKIYSYRLRDLQMKAIDIPKTLEQLDKKEYEDIFKKFDTNAAYIQNFKSYQIRNKEYTTNAINLNAERIEVDKSLQFKIKQSDKIKNEYLTFVVDTESDEYVRCSKEVAMLYDKATHYREEINTRYSMLLDDVSDIEKQIFYNSKIAELKMKDKLILDMANVINDKYSPYVLSTVLAQSTSETFIFTYFYDLAINSIKYHLTIGRKQNIKRFKYIKDVNGEIEYLLDRYTKVQIDDVPDISSNLQAEFESQANNKLNKAVLGHYWILGLDESKKSVMLENVLLDTNVRMIDYKGTLKPHLISRDGEVLGSLKASKNIIADVLADKIIKYEVVEVKDKSMLVNVIDVKGFNGF